MIENHETHHTSHLRSWTGPMRSHQMHSISFWPLSKRWNQYSHVFIYGACSPYASHSNRCPSAALFPKLKQKSSASRKCYLHKHKSFSHLSGDLWIPSQKNCAGLVATNESSQFLIPCSDVNRLPVKAFCIDRNK